MNIYYTTVIVTIITFAFCLFYYKILFKKAFSEEVVSRHGSKKIANTQKITLWMASFASILLTVLVYGIFGYVFNFFLLAPPSTPYALSIFIWLAIVSSLVFAAARVKQPQIITYLHAVFWLIALILYAILFPLLMQLNWAF